MTLSILFIAQATGIQLTFGQQFTMLFVMLFTSKGAAGVAGAGFVALAATIPALGVLPVGGLALLLGIERFMSEIRAVTNLFSNIFCDGGNVEIDGRVGRPVHEPCARQQ